MNTFPLFKPKSYQSSTLIIVIINIITSAVIPTISTIINQITNNKHPPYNIGAEGMAYPWGMAYFNKNVK